ncbi:MAG: GH25 family lysozyme [Eubacteriales bacterium]|nr:GH25 family lysozyme [Eubacteriales bacterium]
MKKWKKLWTAGLFALMVGVGLGTLQPRRVSGADVNPALIRQNVNIADRLQRVGDTTGSSVSKNAWKRVNGVYYNGSGNVVPDVVTRGIDVSEWQGRIDWRKVKNSDVDFAFVRISYGLNHLDKYYDHNMTQANQAGVPVGTYVYSLATNTRTALKEAQLAIRQMDGYLVSYPVVFDIEYSKMAELSKAKVAQIALAFCNEVRAAGYTPMVYLNPNWYDNHVDMSRLSGIPVWLASYSDTKPAPDRDKYNYGIWQCTAGNLGSGSYMVTTKGLIDGIPKENNVDLNYGFVDYTKLVVPRTSALEGYEPAAKADTTPGQDSETEEEEDGWETVDGKKYYYENGEMALGWQEIDGKHYYFHPTKGYLYVNKLLNLNGKIFYVDKNGVRVTNRWVKKGGNRYYMGKYGLALKGAQRVKGKYYYFDMETRVLCTNKKVERKGKIMYYGKNGVRFNRGFLTLEEDGRSNTYYFKRSGRAKTGWAVIRGKRYYFRPSGELRGARVENTRCTINGRVYQFDKNGLVVRSYEK